MAVGVTRGSEARPTSPGIKRPASFAAATRSNAASCCLVDIKAPPVACERRRRPTHCLRRGHADQCLGDRAGNGQPAGGNLHEGGLEELARAVKQELAHRAQSSLVPHKHERASVWLGAGAPFSVALACTRQPDLLKQRAQRGPLWAFLQHAAHGQFRCLAARLGHAWSPSLRGRAGSRRRCRGRQRLVASLTLGVRVGA